MINPPPPASEVFGMNAADLMGPDEPDGAELLPATIGEMSQEEFAENMAGLINYIMDWRETREEQYSNQQYVLGGSTPSGGGASIDAILMG